MAESEDFGQPKGFHLGACKRGWKVGAPADEGCHPDCPRRLWAENERLRAQVQFLVDNIGEWGLLEDDGFTFPDGGFVPVSGDFGASTD